MATKTISSPLGLIKIIADQSGVQSIQFTDEPENSGDDAVMKPIVSTLETYLAGKEVDWTKLKIHQQGTPFQRAVWAGAQRIPYGETWSYGELAGAIGKPAAARAVGNALNKNPFLLLVPCHRIVQSSGKPGGFGAQPWRKEWLLEHEQAHV